MPVDALNAVLAMACGCFGAWLFGVAAGHKLTDFRRFSATLSAYQLAPQAVTPALAGLVVGLELVAAITLLMVFLVPIVLPGYEGALFARPAALLAPLLLLGYAIAMAVNLLRGRRSIDCGCGGAPMPLSKTLVLRNLLLGSALIWALLLVPANAFAQAGLQGSGGWLLLLVVSGSLVLCFIYLIVNQLLANRAVHERLWVQH